MKEISVTELNTKKENGEQFQLIDIREANELEICEIGGEHIPMGEVMDSVEKISRDMPVIIHCRSGGRSGAVVQALEMNHGFENLYNLAGGILAWADEVDASMNKY